MKRTKKHIIILFKNCKIIAAKWRKAFFFFFFLDSRSESPNVHKFARPVNCDG